MLEFNGVWLCSHAIGTLRTFECSALNRAGKFGSPYSRLINARTAAHLHAVGEPKIEGHLEEGKMSQHLEPSERPISIDRARAAFLKAIEDKTPEVLDWLEEHAMPILKRNDLQSLDDEVWYWGLRLSLSEALFSAAAEQTIEKLSNGCEPALALNLYEWGGLEQEAMNTLRGWALPRLIELRDCLHDWAKHYGLPITEWMIEIAFESIRHWTRAEPRQRFVTRRVIYSLLGEFPEFAFKFESWNPLEIDEGGYKARAKARLQIAINEYLERCNKMIPAGSLIPALNQKQMEHYQWLALYQCTPMSYADIAASENKEASTVRDGVREAAERLGMTKILRRKAPGRRQRSKDRSPRRRERRQ